MKKTAKISAKHVNEHIKFRRPKMSTRKKPGDSPGTAIHTGKKILNNVIVTIHSFNEKNFSSHTVKTIDKIDTDLTNKTKIWVQVQGLHDIDTLQTVWKHFNLHPLVEEDIVNTNQRPKVEPYNDYIFLVLRMINYAKDEQTSINEQVSIVLGANYVITFQESDTPIFSPVIKRLEQNDTRLRKLGPDYLAYALTDCIVDNYYNSLYTIDDIIEGIEEEVIANPKKHHLQQIHSLRNDLMVFRKSAWSLRDGLNSLLRDESPLISDEVKIFTRDVHDHLVQVIDTLENSREMVYSLYDMYMSNLSNRMNEVMKVLTIIATIFIPLTFIAGIYGMNFNPKSSPLNMPELNWYWGYPASIGLMAAITIIMLVFFKRKGWL
ncbi:MAG: magnesium/cobalt transporter CorA [Bacteroidales bacterium]